MITTCIGVPSFAALRRVGEVGVAQPVAALTQSRVVDDVVGAEVAHGVELEVRDAAGEACLQTLHAGRQRHQSQWQVEARRLRRERRRRESERFLEARVAVVRHVEGASERVFARGQVQRCAGDVLDAHVGEPLSAVARDRAQ
jgi:hypothetical protein